MARVQRAAATLEGELSEIRAGRGAPVYLLEGDPFLALRGARRIAEALVPEAERSLNVVELDAAATPSEVAAEVATGGLFGGAKAVVVEDPAFLKSREDAREAFDRAREMWASGRQRESARRLVALAARLGLEAGREGASPEEWCRELGREALTPADADFLDGALLYAAERDIRAGKEDAAPLEALLAGGLPPGRTLVLACGKVDGRSPLVKRLEAAGRRLVLAIPVEGQWDEERPVLGPLAAELLAGTGKSLDRQGEDRLASLVGADARTLAAELEKLVAYVGEREVIGAADVEALVARVASDPFFALGNAVEGRDLSRSLEVLHRSLADGASPHMLVASLAATVRRLLVERERGRVAARGRRIGSFSEWSALVLPTIPEEELGKKKPYGFWMKYQAAARFSRGELLSALASLAEADHAMKTGGDGVLLIERCLFALFGTGDAERRTA
ncbi:MAG TPA: DNA polymerase III subunit delta [Anaeromyxobacteraceae bacterium]|nr:DNA polymerase III subunit delta [Anaeromyxobacteraceae bacterium]